MPRGWHGDSRRHSLAARGIETNSNTAIVPTGPHESTRLEERDPRMPDPDKIYFTGDRIRIEDDDTDRILDYEIGEDGVARPVGEAAPERRREVRREKEPEVTNEEWPDGKRNKERQRRDEERKKEREERPKESGKTLEDIIARTLVEAERIKMEGEAKRLHAEADFKVKKKRWNNEADKLRENFSKVWAGVDTTIDPKVKLSKKNAKRELEEDLALKKEKIKGENKLKMLEVEEYLERSKDLERTARKINAYKEYRAEIKYHGDFHP